MIHAVGPIWRGGTQGEAEKLSAAYRRSLELAVEHGCDSIAVPALSTGAYGYPLDQAAKIAVGVVMDFLKEHGKPALVRFLLFGERAYRAYAAALDESRPSPDYSRHHSNPKRKRGLGSELSSLTLRVTYARLAAVIAGP